MDQVLKGIRVLDFSRVFAAPDATQTLGDLGAEVIKVENPQGGDDCRFLGITAEELEALGGPSPSFRAFNRNKKSICLDLGKPAGQAVARSLANRSDVLVNNFRPGTMARFGLDYETLSKDNPGLVYCDFTAYGSKGELAPV
ncbi:MAG: CoA transferase, partial [Pseudomonadota bacterium]|nr:CoA transferase [Pseudomonadota bacterium]